MVARAAKCCRFKEMLQAYHVPELDRQAVQVQDWELGVLEVVNARLLALHLRVAHLGHLPPAPQRLHGLW